MTVTIKTYLLTNFTITSGAGYWNKTFLNTNDPRSYQFPFFVSFRNKITRSDDLSRAYIQITRSVTVARDRVLQPKLQIDYFHNKSTNGLFKYSGFSVELGTSFQF